MKAGAGRAYSKIVLPEPEVPNPSLQILEKAIETQAKNEKTVLKHYIFRAVRRCNVAENLRPSKSTSRVSNKSTYQISTCCLNLERSYTRSKLDK